MPTEIEAKMKVDDHDAARKKLRAVGATLIGRFAETNTFFDRPDDSLRNANTGLRLRVNRDVDRGTIELIVTYKGPTQAGPLKSREEIEINVSDAAGTIALFQRLGFAEKLTFEKSRESWKLGDCKIELDELPQLGRFIEVEGPGETQVMAAINKLALSHLPLIKTGYASMIRSHESASM